MRLATARERAVAGLRAIATLEESVADIIDEPGYFGEMAELLRLSASDRREAVAELSGCVPAGRRLRVVRGGCEPTPTGQEAS